MSSSDQARQGRGGGGQAGAWTAECCKAESSRRLDDKYLEEHLGRHYAEGVIRGVSSHNLPMHHLAPPVRLVGETRPSPTDLVPPSFRPPQGPRRCHVARC